MQKLTVSIARILEKFLYGLERMLTVGILILAIGCITTCLYHAAYRQVWWYVIVLHGCGATGGALFSMVECVLVEAIHPENMEKAFSYEQIERRKARLDKEGNALGWAAIAAMIVGRIMVGGFSQTFTGDPWWVTVEKVPFFVMVPFGFYQNIQIMIFDSILKAQNK